ncbi:protochlorophyllide-dependent translocon component 52, chloroplastic-like isoform X1 [Cannabis sativa]|uniref:protochlorophyllide-dependent translocon component 52, chloroplastic-like isoform X1 n=1 Tax=Cannabis sativa TaxID=3483 RepID=UPI0029CA5E79|nr:protochlorophyllide-dependent translocon component 52, chloroplastic-like isoform X1 [Cannabis sativa]
MVALTSISLLLHSLPNNKLLHYHSNIKYTKPISSSFSYGQRSTNKASRSKLYTSISSVSTNLTDPFEAELESSQTPDGKFDWYSNWCPIMPVCDLDKRRPHGKKVMGVDVVVWWDKNESEWKVFDDSCPHRLAPLSEGRIDQWGRLQCVYHGWCFNGSGNCKFIPQAPPDGPPVHTSKRACVSVYPSIVQNGIVWFWPNTDPKYKNIITKQKPPYIAEMDDPSFSQLIVNREFHYGYEVMVENLMDPAHVPYAHHGLMRTRLPGNADREGGIPLEMTLESFNINGFTGMSDPGFNQFYAPFVFYSSMPLNLNQDNHNNNQAKKDILNNNNKTMALVFICVPISPGRSRLILSASNPRRFNDWFNKIIPRWIIHISVNAVLDSDTYLLHLEERKMMDAGVGKWNKACFVPTKSDVHVVAFRKWLNKYGGGQVDWGGKFSGALPPTPPREQLMDRYWSHVVNCSSCSAAHKGLKVLEVMLQVMSIALIGYVGVINKQSQTLKIGMVSMALLCFVASKWLSHFIHKIFHFHDYDHAFR